MKKSIKVILLVVGIILLSNKLLNGDKKPKFKKGMNRKFTESDLKKSFGQVKRVFGEDLAATIEQLYRKETRNFDSGQFRKTFSAGMEAVKGKESFPYGWGSLRQFVEKYPKYGGEFYTVPMTENRTGKTKVFIGFPTLESAVMFTAFMVNKRGDAGLWRSLDPEIAARYAESLKSYPVKFT